MDPNTINMFIYYKLNLQQCFYITIIYTATWFVFFEVNIPVQWECPYANHFTGTIP